MQRRIGHRGDADHLTAVVDVEGQVIARTSETAEVRDRVALPEQCVQRIHANTRPADDLSAFVECDRPAGDVTGVDPSEAATAYARRHALSTMTFTVGTAQDLGLPDAAFDVVTCTLAIHHIPARKRQAAFGEMYRVTKPGGRLLAADFDPSRRPLPLHPGGQRMRRAAATVGSLQELAAIAGYRVESTGRLPLLRYVLAVRPEHEARP